VEKGERKKSSAFSPDSKKRSGEGEKKGKEGLLGRGALRRGSNLSKSLIGLRRKKSKRGGKPAFPTKFGTGGMSESRK